MPRSRVAAIPASLTPILGRESEIEQVLALLDRDDLRVVTLLGPGGVGKTRIAQEVARTVERDFAHGACFVALAAIRDPELVPKAVAQALGLQERGSVSAVDLLIDVLSTQHLLLVLDNMEQVVAAASWLSDLIASCPRLKVLVTSRNVLNVTTEQRFVVPPLPVPQDPGANVLESAAIELFAQRARAVDVNFTIDERNRSTVAEICRRLDGLPLAIELAAARVNILSPAAILARLSNRLNLLSGGRRDRDPRMNSMREAIGWSYDLLSDEHKALFGRLSVFVGGFSLEAAAFVASYPEPPLDESDILDASDSLVNQSLVYAVDSETGPRFAMLETIREYGLAELDRDEAAELAKLAHAEYFMALAAIAVDDQRGPRRGTWQARLDSEHHNIRASSPWLTDHGRIANSIELYWHIVYFHIARGHSREARTQFEVWLGHPSLVPRSRAHALALSMAAVYAIPAGDFARFPVLVDEAIQMFRELDDERGLIFGFAVLSIAPPADTPEACVLTIKRLSEGIDRSRRSGFERYLGIILGNLSLLYEKHGDIERAQRLNEELEELARATGDRWLIATNRCSQSSDALRSGNLERARLLAGEALEIFRELGDLRHAPIAEEYLGTCARAAGDLETAASYLNSGLQSARAVGDRSVETLSLVELAKVALAGNDLGTAWGTMEQLFERMSTFDSPELLTTYPDVLASVAQAAGHHEQAARFLGVADGFFDRFETRRGWKHDVDAYL